jgi:hypothetical protein
VGWVVATGVVDVQPIMAIITNPIKIVEIILLIFLSSGRISLSYG